MRRRAWWAVVLLLACARIASAERAGEEILYPGEAFAKLDTFEALNLEDADKLYGKRDYTGAYAAYKAFTFDFEKSPALPYALLRMGRCLHRLDKRNAAIQAYQQVVDYFPNAVRYAAAALYYIGECHGQNGDDAKKTAVWARMVKDDAYVAQPNSGTALIYLARRMEELGKLDEAAEYHWRTAVAFRQSNPGAAQQARVAVLSHYVTRNPDHEKLKQFYVAAGGFDGRGVHTDKPQEDPRYWDSVMNTALGLRGDADRQERVCRYWAGRFGDAFQKNDGLRIKRFEMQLVYEKDPAAWAARMNKQFVSRPATVQRVIDWLPHFKRDPKEQLAFAMKQGGPLVASAKVSERARMLEVMEPASRGPFYEQFVQPTVAGLKRGEKMWLMERLRWPLRMDEEAQAVMRAVGTGGMSEEEVRQLAFFAANYEGEEEVLRILGRIKDPLFAAKARFDYYYARRHRNRPFQEKALAEIPALEKSPKHAAGATWAKAGLLRDLGRYEEAIKAYQQANRQPDSTWAITDCLVALKRYGEAIRTVQGLESVGGGVAAQACLKAADIYRISGDKGKEVDQLRLVLRRYPKSGQSSEAHRRLESYGVKVTGGEAEAEE